MPGPIKNVIKIKGHYYAVPVNIHSAAWFWYSKAVLAKAGVTEPKTEAEFWSALDKIKASGQIGFAQSGTLTYERATFTAVLLHMGGRDLYNKFYGDKDINAVKSPAFRTVLEKFKRLKQLHRPGRGRPQLERHDGVAGDRQGRIPDRGRLGQGRVSRCGQDGRQGIRLLRRLGPSAPYMISGDVFVLPKTSNKEAIAAQQLMAKVITSPATQVAFNMKKGSIPIRPDVDASGMDICAQAGVIALKDPARQTPDPSMLMAPDMYGKVADVITKFWNTDMKPEEAQNQLVAVLSAK